MQEIWGAAKFIACCLSIGVILQCQLGFAQAPLKHPGAAQIASNASAYPTKPIRVVVPSAPGSTADVLARLLAQHLTESLAQQWVVDNRAGAAGIIGSNVVARASPDGYTLLFIAGNHAINPSLHSDLPYDPVRDFAPITQMGAAPLLLVAHSSFAAASARELIAVAKAKPGQINYASGGKGTPSHLAMELFNSMAGIKLTHVAYSGGGPVLTAVLSGEVQLTPGGVAIVMPHVRSGKLKALAVTGARRSPAAPEVPTVAESALPGFAVTSWWGLLAPAATPTLIITKLQRETARLLQTPGMRTRLAADGIEPVGSSAGEFDSFIRREIATWAKVIKDAGAQ